LAGKFGEEFAKKLAGNFKIWRENLKNGGKIYIQSFSFSVTPAAQWCQHSTNNPKIVGSNPTPGLNLMGLYHPLDGITNLEYNLLCFLTPNKIIFYEKGTSF
jgi:hypothetical protein